MESAVNCRQLLGMTRSVQPRRVIKFVLLLLVLVIVSIWSLEKQVTQRAATRQRLPLVEGSHSSKADARQRQALVKGSCSSSEGAPLHAAFLLQNRDKLGRVLTKFPAAAVQRRLVPPRLLPCSAITIHTPSGKNVSLEDLQAAISNGQRFPSVVHFILPFLKPQLTFVHFVSILSAFWFLRPARLVLWYVHPPQGEYWDRLRSNFSASGVLEERIVFIRRAAPKQIHNIALNRVEHQSDVMRLDALLLFGGLYLDLDVFVLKPLHKILRASGSKTFVIGRESPTGLCNGVMLAAPNAKFLALWHMAYQSFNNNHWNGHSVILPNLMAQAWPNLVHVEEKSMDRPNWIERALIHGVRSNGQPPVWPWWDINFCVHLWIRSYPGLVKEAVVKKEDSMLGEMIRWVLNGQKPQHALQKSREVAS